MIKFPRVVVLSVLVYVLPFISMLSLDVIAEEKSRWGITTEKQLEKNQHATIENPGLETQPSSEKGKSQQPSQPAAQKQTPSMNHTTTEETAPTQGKGANVDSKQSPKLTTKTVPRSKNPAPAAKISKPATKSVVWANQQQKTTCQAYTKDLQELFIKTRHYSIQGAPCKTRDFAAAFRHVKEKCAYGCPNGFLRHSGYTDRIIRNIAHLEKIGNDRCSDKKSPMPMPPAQ